jgi:serine/threonine-protein kinase
MKLFDLFQASDGPVSSAPAWTAGQSAGGSSIVPPRCRVVGSWVTGSQFFGAVSQLLLSRLRIVSLIALVPTLLFLTRRLFSELASPIEGLGLIFHFGLIVVLAGLTGLLWGRKQYSLRSLRSIELVLFGSLAGFFAWLQINLLHGDPLWHASSSGTEIDRLIITVTGFRWFFLIVVYGVFIPNTWLRCALFTSGAALIPLVLTTLSAWVQHRLDPGVLLGLYELAVVLGTGVIVAVMGSYRLEKLQRQAFEAQQLGQYRLLRLLASGGMGDVYLAEHVLLRRPCAIKLIRPDQAGDRATLERFEHEVQAMATLTHWNTVLVFDYGHADDGTFYYVMEYISGPTLEALVARHGSLPAARAIHLLRQICGALREAHGIGLLHRDIKPTNLLVSTRGGVHDVIKLLDFGLVQEIGLGRKAERLTVEGTILGSPPYMAPEQAAGRTDIDVRADLYALGGVAYFLLTGQPPFPRETAMQMMLAHAYEPVVPPRTIRPEIPEDLEAVLLRCLRKKPDERYAGVDELDKALEACADAQGWTEERAAAWWGALEGQEETDARSSMTGETQS